MSTTSSSTSSTIAPLSLFLLSNLPPNSSFGLDTKQWTVAKFSGVKNIPSGLHLFTFSASPNSTNSTNPNDTISRGIGIRHGLFKFFNSFESETLIEEWDNISEELVSDSTEEIWSIKRKRNFNKNKKSTIITTTSSTSTKELGITTLKDSNGDEVEEEITPIIISPDYLKTLDKSLASYPVDLESNWKSLTNFISKRTIFRVIGQDARGNSRVDASMGTNLDATELREAGKKIWGKEREEERNDNVEKEEQEKEIIKEEVLEFLKIDSKRSWPSGAVGSELTKWSKDKSWYLSSVIFNQLGNQPEDITEYLAELQLSFTLFVLLHNFSSLTIYKSLFSLLCQSPSILHPLNSTTNPPNPELIQKASLPLYKSFLTLFKIQLDFLEDTFFSTELPDLETFFLDQLSALQSNLQEAGLDWELIDSNSSTDQAGAKSIWNLIIIEWDSIINLSMKKFGWNLESIRLGKSRRDAQRLENQFIDPSAVNTVGRDDDEIDLEDLEEGEDGPVIVEL